MTVFLRRLFGLQRQDEFGVFSRFHLNGDFPFVFVGDRFQNGKPESAPARLRTAGSVLAVEPLEHAVFVLFLHGAAGYCIRRARGGRSRF